MTNNKKTLVIVESPGKVNKIQNILGENYVVTSCQGHITDLIKGGKFGLGIDVDDNFKTRYVILPDKISILNNIINLGKECDEILLASDLDREGEAIAWHLKERLAGLDKPIKRDRKSVV